MDNAKNKSIERVPQPLKPGSGGDDDIHTAKELGYQGKDDAEPKTKLIKLDTNSENFQVTENIELNKYFLESKYIESFQDNWSNFKNITDDKSGTQIFGKPFQISILKNFLSDTKITNNLVKEMVYIEWSRKQMDLYEFYQSTDLSNMKSKYLAAFFQTLQTKIMPWIEKLCNIKLNFVSASCSMYNCGDYLLVHDDLLKDRQIAFIYYLSPWENVEEWTDEMGGCLEIFNTDEKCFPHFPVELKIHPRNNQFAFFKVGSKSFHHVAEVTTFDYPRLTINGWFHGENNTDVIEDDLRPLSPPKFEAPISKSIDLAAYINGIYLNHKTKNRIQKHIEDNSEICLEEFLLPQVFNRILMEIKSNEKIHWMEKGPANAQSYQILDLSNLNNYLQCIIDVFKSTSFLSLLRDYTDLDLSGTKAKDPSLNIEIQKWTHGSYTVLGDGAMCDDNTLDLVYYLNASENAGVITYLSPNTEEDILYADQTDDDESILLTIDPKDNAMSIVYRCEGTTKFTKYVPKKTDLSNGPVYILCCSYKE